MIESQSKPTIKIIECPRDAMQGWSTFIPTKTKIKYINGLLKVGFDTLDCGSFVSAKAIPQMADTAEVIEGLDLSGSKTKLLAIVANVRGAEEAVQFDKISCLGFPFSISPTFQKRNTNSTIEESLERVEFIQNLCLKHNKELVIYLSMGFGNPYGDEYNEEILIQYADKIAALGVGIISLADTVGVATPEQILVALNTLIPKYPAIEFGVHLHTSASNWQQKLEAAANANCVRFDGALKGIGGCPMAKDELVGNLNTENVVKFFKDRGIDLALNEPAFLESILKAEEVFTV